jgi:hypothetical protein
MFVSTEWLYLQSSRPVLIGSENSSAGQMDFIGVLAGTSTDTGLAFPSRPKHLYSTRVLDRGSHHDHEFGEDGESDHDSAIEDSPQQCRAYQHTQVRKPRPTSGECHDEPSSHPVPGAKPPGHRDKNVGCACTESRAHDESLYCILQPSISARGSVQGENLGISFELGPRTWGGMNRRKPTERLVVFRRMRHSTTLSSRFSLCPACGRERQGGSAYENSLGHDDSL